MKTLKILSVVSLSLTAFVAKSDPLVEKDGRLEINWSTGKVKFYGTSVGQLPKDGTWRSHEQRAWGEGLAYFEKNLEGIYAKKLGLSESKLVEKPALIKATTSTNTTYFGDSRVKVSLEASLNSLISQTLASTSGKALPKNGSTRVEIRLPASASASAVVSIQDEKGAELLSQADMAETIKNGANLNKWVSNTNDSPSLNVAPAILEATSSKRGVLKVKSSDWKPQFANAIANGQATMILVR